MKSQVHFKDIQKIILDHLTSAKHSISIAVAWLTDEEIFQKLTLIANSGIKVELLLIDDAINREISNINHSLLEQAGGKITFIRHANGDSIMHHKFCIIDENTILTGSYNWSKRAKSNDENILVLTDNFKLIQDFKNEFNQIKSTHVSSNIKKTVKFDEEQSSIEEVKIEAITIVPCVLKNNPNKHGYATSDFKKIVIPCVFEYTFQFEGNYARVIYEGHTRFVTKDGYIIKPAELMDTLYGEFRAGITCAFIGRDIYSMSGPYGFINQNSPDLVIIPFIYERANDFSESLAAVKHKGKWGFIDENGNGVIPFIYDYAECFKFGSAVVKKNAKWGIIDKKNNELIPFIYDGFISKPNYESYHIIQSENKRGYFDRQNLKIILPMIYDDAKFFSENLAAVCLNNKWGFIDEKGEIVIDIQYDNVLEFSGGLAGVNLKSKWGFINSKNEIVIPHKYARVESFKNGNAKVEYSTSAKDKIIRTLSLGLVTPKIKTGKINTIGNECE